MKKLDSIFRLSILSDTNATLRFCNAFLNTTQRSKTWELGRIGSRASKKHGVLTVGFGKNL